MDINLLAVSIGNSRVAVGVFKSGELVSSTRHTLSDETALRTGVEEAWKLIARLEGSAVAFASTNKAAEANVIAMLRTASDEKPLRIGDDIDLPMPVKTKDAPNTGVDRVLNVAAAYEQMGKACVVVDAGATVTVDLCSDSGEFRGGAIAPGVAMSLDALASQTSLPKVDFAVPTGHVGESTIEALRMGVYHGVRGLVKELAESYALELGNWPEIIATGGDAELLFGGWELIHAVAPDLGLYGIAKAFADHEIENG